MIFVLLGIYVSDTGNNRIIVISQSGAFESVAGSGIASDTDGVALSSGVAAPQKLRYNYELNGILLTTNNCVRLLKYGNLSTLAGSSTSGLVDGFGNLAKFSVPSSVVALNSSYYLVGDESNRVIRSMVLQQNQLQWKVSTISSVQSKPVNSIIADGLKFVYFVVDKSNQLSRMSLATGLVEVFCGQGSSGNLDGPCGSATFTDLQDLVFDNLGNLVLLGKNTIRFVNMTSKSTKFLAGSGSNGFVDGLGSIARFDSASAITFDLLTGVDILLYFC
jgi:hypothetical protein